MPMKLADQFKIVPKKLFIGNRVKLRGRGWHVPTMTVVIAHIKVA